MITISAPPAFALTLLAFTATIASAEPPRTFANPVYGGQDPWVTQADDGYYYSAAETSPGSKGVYVYKSRGLTDRGIRHRVFSAPREGKFTAQIWAPELHHIDGHWYIYTCADDGDNANHRAIVLRATSDDPQGEYEFAAELLTPGWAIDATVFRGPDHKLYCIWSGWPADVPADSTQHLFISAMSDPLTLVGPAVDISGNMRDWECVDRPAGLNEGPQVLEHDGKLFVIYSASGSWTADYCLGMLALAGGDLLEATNWTKHPEPVFRRAGNVYGPGHCSFVKSPDGSEDWLVYHSSIDPAGSWNRCVSLQRFTWNDDGTPDFGTPPQWGDALPVPAGEPTLVPGPPLTETFDNTDRWQIQGNFRGNSMRVRDEEYCVDATRDPRYGDKSLVRSFDYNNLTLSTEIRIDDGRDGGGLLFRVSSSSIGPERFIGYVAHLSQRGFVELSKCDGKSRTVLARSEVQTKQGKWHKLMVVAQGARLSVYVDDSPAAAIIATDDTYRSGQVGLRVVDSDARFDNFHVEPAAAE